MKYKEELDERQRLAEYWTNEDIISGSQPLYCDFATRRLLDKTFSKSLSDKRGLDIGCGHGRMMKYFSKRGMRIYGMDISKEAVKVAATGASSVLTADALKLPFKEDSFDIVFSLGVIEHFHNTIASVAEHVRVTCSGGTIIIIVPHLISPYVIAALAWHTLRGTIRYGLITCSGKMYTKGYLKWMMEKSGCKNIHITAYHGSAILKFVTRQVHKEWALKIEKTFFSRFFGHLLFAVGRKK